LIDTKRFSKNENQCNEAGAANQSETKSNISLQCYHKKYIIHMGTHEHYLSLSHTHTPLVSYIYCKYKPHVTGLANPALFG